MAEDYTVEQGDCISSIAFDHGFFWGTLWNHANNAALKQKRKDPNVLMEGDMVHIPDLTLKEDSAATERKHRFKLKGVPAKLRLQLLLDEEPRANESYTLYVDQVEKAKGRTDGDGFVEAPVPPNAKQARLLIGTGDEREEYVMELGTVDPIDTDDGVRERLHNMGYPASEDLGQAIEAFQARERLSVTGKTDDTTRERLKERFGQ